MTKAATTYFTLQKAIGTIEADSRQQAWLDEFTDMVGSGEYLMPTDTQIVCECIDGRCGTRESLRPNGAAGSQSMMVADDLTSKRFVRAGMETTRSQYRATLNFLYDNAYPIGGHTTRGAAPNNSGCGANDNLPAIYAFIAKEGAELRKLAANLGMHVDDETHELIVKNAAGRTDFSEGAELLNTLRKQPCARLSSVNGPHREVLALINLREHTTLDRYSLRDEFGGDYQAFNMDVWAFEKSAKIISENSRDAEQKLAAMLYYNLATAHVLAGTGLRVVVVS